MDQRPKCDMNGQIYQLPISTWKNTQQPLDSTEIKMKTIIR